MPDASTPDAAAPDAGPPTRPEDVPAVPLGGDPATACPSAFAASAPVAGLNTGFTSAGQDRAFHLILPPATFTGPRPIFVAFNGTGESGPSFSARAELEDFAARGFVVAAPSSNDNGTVWPIWDDMRLADDHARPNADLQYFDDLLACLGAHLEIDSNRIYVGGHSAGGIFTNAVLQRRGEVIAGGIVASGIFDLTSPPDLGTLDPMFVIVTWGGPDDTYSGGVGVVVPEINFVEQASLASQFYEAEPSVGQANCSVDAGGGHYWLPLNEWFVDRLLEHPKGLPGSEADLMVPPSGVAGVTCRTTPFVYVPTLSIECPAATVVTGCQEACQMFADCAAENSTVGPVIAAQLAAMGFTDTTCDGCVAQCELGATTAADAEIFTCLEGRRAMCGGGISGFQPAVQGINECCDARTDSPWCVETCRILLTNDLTPRFLPTCVALVP